MGYFWGIFGWFVSNVFALIVGGFLGHLLGDRVKDAFGGVYRAIKGA